jgi:cytochrome c2
MRLPSRTALKQGANIWHPRELSKFIHKIQHRLVKTAMDRDGEQEEANSRTKKILFLCDGSLELAPQNMVVSE